MNAGLLGLFLCCWCGSMFLPDTF